jgi:tRNA1Val (adenine37-N6)-methyltransferase
MKVGTDGVLLGAWSEVANAGRVLDVGTGTGLIALMTAQRNPNAEIDAIDIDPDAAGQAKENAIRSPFGSQINCIHCSLQDFGKQTGKKYDIIVSNPPFFAHSVKSPQRGRVLARHAGNLPADDLIKTASSLLSGKGKISLIYPYECKAELMALAEENALFLSRITQVFSTPASLPKRILAEFSKCASPPPAEENLIIEEERHVYSDDFTALVKDFYLKMKS